MSLVIAIVIVWAGVCGGALVLCRAARRADEEMVANRTQRFARSELPIQRVESKL